MNKIIKYILISFIIVMPLACYETKDNYKYDDVVVLKVDSVNSIYDMTALTDTLKIFPKVSLSNEKDELVFKWIKFPYYGDAQSAPENIETSIISNNDSLIYPVSDRPGSYTIICRITNKRTGQIIDAQTRLNVNNDFSLGFYVLKEENGNTDLDLQKFYIVPKDENDADEIKTLGVYVNKQEPITNVMSRIIGTPLEGKPISISTALKYSFVDKETSKFKPVTTINVATDKDFYIINIEDLNILRRTSNKSELFYDPSTDVGQVIYSVFNYYGLALFSDKGYFFSSYDLVWGDGGSGMFPYATSIKGGCRPNINIVGESDCCFLFDDLNGRFLRTDVNGNVTIFLNQDKDGMPLDTTLLMPNNISHKLKFMGRNTVDGWRAIAAYALFEDTKDSETLFLYHLLTDNGTFSPVVSVTPIKGKLINRAKMFATNENQAKVIYFVTDNKLYYYSIDTGEEIEIKPEEFDGDGEIVYIKNRFWLGSWSNEVLNFDNLVIATQKGDSYKIYMYDFLGALPIGKPRRVYEGNGKFVSLQFITPDFTARKGSSLSLSY